MDSTPGVRKGASRDLYDFAGYAMMLRIVYWIEDIPNYFSLRHAANVTVKRALEEEGVRLASPITRA